MNNNKRILLIDDEDVMIFGFSKVLKEPGIDVDCAQTLDEATALIRAHQYHAALVDLRLSSSIEMEGLDCVRLLTASQDACKIIVLTAYGGNSIKEQARKLGAHLFFEKPIEPETIKTALKTFGVYTTNS